MVVISFYLPEIYKEYSEDLLSQANQGKPDKERFKSLDEWEDSLFRNYRSNFIDNYRRWEMDRKVVDLRTVRLAPEGLLEPGKRIDAPFKIDTGSVKVQGRQTKERPYKRAKQLGDMSLEWFKRALAFYREYGRLMAGLEPGIEQRAQSVSELLSLVVEQNAWQLIAQADKKRAEAEDKELTEQKKVSRSVHKSDGSRGYEVGD